MSERCGQHGGDFSGLSPELSTFSEKRHFVDPVMLESFMADAVAWSGRLVGLGAALAGGGGIG